MQLRKISNSSQDLVTIQRRRPRPGEAPTKAEAPGGNARQEFAGHPEFVRLDGLVQTLFRRKWTIAGGAALGLVLALTAALVQTPTYQATVALEIQGFNENFLNRREVDPTADTSNYASEPYLQTQIRLLQTEALIARVVDSLHMDRRPEFQPQPSRLDAFRGAVPTPPKPASLRESVIKNAARNLQVRFSGQTRIVEVLFDSPDPRLAADFPNTLADEFIAQTLDRRVSATHHTGEWLSKQLKELKATLQDSEQRLHNYVASNGLLFTSGKDSVAEANLRQLQTALLGAHEDRVAEQSKYELAASAPQDAMSEDLDSETLRSYHVKLTDLRRELAESRTVLTPAHYKVKQIQAQINELQSALDRERSGILERLRKAYESARRREELLRSDYDSEMLVVTNQSSKELAYNTLKREMEGNRQLYETTLQRVKEADVASAIRANNIQIVDPAKVPERAIKPSRPLYCAIGLFLGSFMGLGLALFLERTDRRMHTPAEVRRCVNVPQLGAIPTASVDLPYSEQSRPWTIFTQGGAGAEGASEGDGAFLRNWLELVTWRHRQSALAESFRAVLASLLFSSEAANECAVIVLTSACSSEGKTTVVCNLGIALAEAGHKVLLIDGDRRRPRLHEIFKTPNAPGLYDLLLDQAALHPHATKTMAYRTDIPRLYVLPSGGRGAGAANIIGNGRVAELLEGFRSNFDIILIDTPPVLALSDARGFGRLADGVALVIRADRTPQDAAFAAWQRLSDDGIHVLGTILNAWNPNKNQDYSYSDLSTQPRA
jgi:succinoglycan biosynthesis transport protein ExoP